MCLYWNLLKQSVWKGLPVRQAAQELMRIEDEIHNRIKKQAKEHQGIPPAASGILAVWMIRVIAVVASPCCYRMPNPSDDDSSDVADHHVAKKHQGTIRF
ncbi:MAG: hypothetical protein V1685_04030 [Parcubacteria group bacterium]